MTTVIRLARGEQDVLRSSGYLAMALAGGLSLALLLVWAVASQGKTSAVVIAGMFALGCWPILVAFRGQLQKGLLLGLAATLSISLKFHLAYRADHFGGAIGYRVSITELLVAAILLCAAWGASHSRKVPIRINKPIFLAFSVYLLFAAMSAFASDDVEVGLYQLSALITSFLLFVFLSNYLTTRERIRVFVSGLLLGIVLQSAVAIVQVKRPGLLSLNFLGASEEVEPDQADGNIDLPDVDLGTTTVGGEITHRPTGLLIHPNVLALYLVLMIPLALAAWLGSRNTWMEWFGSSRRLQSSGVPSDNILDALPVQRGWGRIAGGTGAGLPVLVARSASAFYDTQANAAGPDVSGGSGRLGRQGPDNLSARDGIFVRSDRLPASTWERRRSACWPIISLSGWD